MRGASASEFHHLGGSLQLESDRAERTDTGTPAEVVYTCIRAPEPISISGPIVGENVPLVKAHPPGVGHIRAASYEESSISVHSIGDTKPGE